MMSKQITIEYCGQPACPHYEALPCKNEYGFKVPYCVYKHPFVALGEQSEIPDWCPLPDPERVSVKNVVQEIAELQELLRVKLK
jgi:hypothetical protein